MHHTARTRMVIKKINDGWMDGWVLTGCVIQPRLIALRLGEPPVRSANRHIQDQIEF